MVVFNMDKWKRNGNTIYNDDSIGYENAKKRLEKLKENKLKEQNIEEIKRKVDIIWYYLKKMQIIPDNIN